MQHADRVLLAGANIPALLRPARAAVLRHDQGLAGGVRQGVRGAVRDDPPSRDKQAAERGQVLRAPAGDGRAALDVPRIRTTQRGGDDVVVADLRQDPLPGTRGAPGSRDAPGPVQRPVHVRRLRGPLPARESAGHALRHQFFHLDRPGRPHGCASQAPQGGAQADHGAADGRRPRRRRRLGLGLVVVLVLVLVLVVLGLVLGLLGLESLGQFKFILVQ
mmetsp:Transcript_25127/g.70563  ORF Transcript_25127/g.70563 Transcript_25127/m.70563 type:complete len:219 (+) Transcript_25127:1183-1839(+)